MAGTESITHEELQLAARNHGMPLEALRYAVTPLGLHYLLSHFDIPLVDPAVWRLSVGGLVERPLELTLADIEARDAIHRTVTMECAGNGRARLNPRPFSQPWLDEAVSTATWTGLPLRSLLEEAGLRGDATEVVFSGLDRGLENGVEQAFERSLTVEDALDRGAVLAHAINGAPLPPQHGYPLRLVVPGWYGMASVKWLSRITATSEPFTGPQQASAYRLRRHEADPGVPLTRMAPRALMVPPGLPEFPTRRRTLEEGPCLLEGRAWSGWAPIVTVELSEDGGRAWVEADLEPAEGAHAWAAWSVLWDARPGERELCLRAHDAAGNVQPLRPEWNVGGYANNAVQRVRVTVQARASGH